MTRGRKEKAGGALVWFLVGVAAAGIALVAYSLEEARRARAERRSNPPPIYHDPAVPRDDDTVPLKLPEFREEEAVPPEEVLR